MEDMAASSGNGGLYFDDEDHWKTTTDSFDNDNRDNLRGNQLPAAPKENIPCRSRDIDSSGMLSKLSSNNNSSLSSNEPLGKADTTSTKSTQPAQRAPNPPPAHNRLQRKPMPNTKWQK